MAQQAHDKPTRRNLLLTGAAVLFAVLAIALCLLLRPTTGGDGVFIVRTKSGETLTVPENETRTVVIRDGAFVETTTGEGDENVIRIENGQARMIEANCPRGECKEQGVLDAETVKKRPLGAWIICMPHGVTVEYRGGGQ